MSRYLFCEISHANLRTLEYLSSRYYIHVAEKAIQRKFIRASEKVSGMSLCSEVCGQTHHRLETNKQEGTIYTCALGKGVGGRVKVQNGIGSLSIIHQSQYRDTYVYLEKKTAGYANIPYPAGLIQFVRT